mmetsp:Transcript_14042/g.25397  ORF Transcript_14042/g.25397 Transcript_14042/m.25397 type:complete len:91 (-) Transcript_14042:480-752(-)
MELTLKSHHRQRLIVLLTVQTTAPTAERQNIPRASQIQPPFRSPPSSAVGTADSITTKHPHGNMNAMKNAMLDPAKLHTTATPVTATAAR